MTEITDRNFALEYDESYGKYDFIVNLFQLGRDRAHRMQAHKFAGLKKGDTVLDICCGSGLSFAATEQIIGPEGKIIAIDLNGKMLQLARERAKKHNWTNIEFLECDINILELNHQADVALFALCWYDKDMCAQWVKKLSTYLKPGTGSFCFIDYKYPSNWLRRIADPVLSLLVKWLGEAYSVEDLKWDPMQEIAPLLNEPRYKAIYLDSLFTLTGKPK